MRSDRKREEKQARKEAKRAKSNRFYRVISVIYTVLALCFIGLLLWLNVLPAKYLYTVIGILILISLFIVPVMFSRRGKPKRKRIAAIFAVLLIAAFGVGTYYMAETIGFLNDITKIGQAKEEFYLVVKDDSEYEEAAQLSGKTVGVHASADSVYAEARNKLKDEVSIRYEYEEELPELMNQLMDESYPAVFISAASYGTITDNDDYLKDGTRVIYKISVEVQKKSRTSHVNVTEEPFNVLVSGLDITGDISNVSRSDVNMVVTVNPKTRKILITSIPRDYYVELPSKDSMDKLTHSGLYGVQETVGAVE